MQGRNRYIQLGEVEKEALKVGYKRGKKAAFRQRCHIILLSNQGQDITRIAEIMDCSRQSIYAWFNRYERHGINGLHTASGGGRPPIFKIENLREVERIKEIVSAHPQQLKQAIPVLEKEFGFSFSKETLIRFLKKTVGHTSDCAL
jgi:transposase